MMRGAVYRPRSAPPEVAWERSLERVEVDVGRCNGAQFERFLDTGGEANIRTPGSGVVVNIFEGMFRYGSERARWHAIGIGQHERVQRARHDERRGADARCDVERIPERAQHALAADAVQLVEVRHDEDISGARGLDVRQQPRQQQRRIPEYLGRRHAAAEQHGARERPAHGPHVERIPHPLAHLAGSSDFRWG